MTIRSGQERTDGYQLRLTKQQNGQREGAVDEVAGAVERSEMSRPFKLVEPDSSLDALAEVADSVAIERDKVERKIIELAEAGFRDEAWKLVVKHFKIKEPRTVKR